MRTYAYNEGGGYIFALLNVLIEWRYSTQNIYKKGAVMPSACNIYTVL